jgi:hypothetical protein
MNRRSKSLSETPNEALARRVAERLCRQPPYRQNWKDFALLEISRALAIVTVQCRAGVSHPYESKEVSDAAAQK